MLDYETQTSYDVTVRATDATDLYAMIAVTIMVNDVNEAPTFDAEPAELSVDENTEADMAIGDPFAAMDVDDGDTLTYTLGGDDMASFAIDAMSGQVMTSGALDYETKSSYSVTVTATDSGDLSAMIAVTITVNDVNEGPCVGGAAVADMTNSGLLADCGVLLNIMDDLVGDGTAELNWSADLAITEWDGLAAGTGRVAGIYLPDSGLAGTVPAGISDLDALTRLTLRDNALTGEIPDLSALDNLERLILSNNALTGGIPTTLGDMDNLEYLYLHGNQLTGGIPDELSSATRLIRIQLHGNGLTGEIPAELGDLPRLRYLLLHNNDLSGEIPMELGNASNMKALYLYKQHADGFDPGGAGQHGGCKRRQREADVPAQQHAERRRAGGAGQPGQPDAPAALGQQPDRVHTGSDSGCGRRR